MVGGIGRETCISPIWGALRQRHASSWGKNMRRVFVGCATLLLLAGLVGTAVWLYGDRLGISQAELRLAATRAFERVGIALLTCDVFSAVAGSNGGVSDCGPAPAVKVERAALVDDQSRDELALQALREDKIYRFVAAAPRRAFVFPVDADEDGHAPIAWSMVPRQKVVFVYAKATQGAGSYDARFARNWQEVAKLQASGKRIYRGAYHFFSAEADPVQQARNYLATVGALGASDMPPSLDLEWDNARSGAKTVDRWARHSPEDIDQRVSKWIETVERATGRRVMIYTAAAWWSERMSGTALLENRPVWIADYGARALDILKPHVPGTVAWTIWQFTDTGVTRDGGVSSQVDVSEFKGSLGAFQKAFSLPRDSG